MVPLAQRKKTSDENNNDGETNKIDNIIVVTQKVEKIIKHDKVGLIVEGMKQAGSVDVRENNSK